MYNLPYFKEHDGEKIRAFIRQHPFAILCGADCEGVPSATQVPLFLEEHEDGLKLVGHFMRKSDHHRAFTENPNVLAIFTLPGTYVSATWYTNPHQASTWNYMSVHVHGRIHFTDEEGLLSILRKTTLHFENGNTASFTVLDNLPKEYVDKLVKAIIGFEISVERMDNVFKLSQNQDEQSYHGIIDHLSRKEGDAGEIADEMRKREGQEKLIE